MAVMSCSPAFFALVVEALVDAGVRQGLQPADASRMAVEAMAGTASTLRAHDLDTLKLRRRVTSPGRLHRTRARGPRGRGHPDGVFRCRRRGREPVTLAAITRVDVANYVQTLITVYVVLIFIRILMSYFRSIPYYRALDVFLRFVTEVTDPWLNLFRRFIPPVRVGPAALDLTPMIAVFALYIIGGLLVVRLIRGY